MFVVFAEHESSSDPIMTEAALLLSPTANLRLHAFYTRLVHTCTLTYTQVATAILYRHHKTPRLSFIIHKHINTKRFECRCKDKQKGFQPGPPGQYSY